MRFEVPQFIEVEDKIFGPFTWKQFLYLGGGGGMCLVLFLIAPLPIFILIGVPFGILASLLAFYPVNNRPFSVMLESAFSFISSNKLYRWKKRGMGVYTGEESQRSTPLVPDESAKLSSNTYNPTIGKGNLSSLSKKLELDSIKNQ